MRWLTCCLISLTAAAYAAEEVCVLQAYAPNAQATMERAKLGLFGKMMTLPSFQDYYRKALALAGKPVAADVDPIAAYPMPKAVEVCLLSRGAAVEPRFGVRAQYGERSQEMIDLFAAQLTNSGTAFPPAGYRCVVEDDWVSFDDGDVMQFPAPPPPGNDDFVLVLHLRDLLTSLGSDAERIGTTLQLGDSDVRIAVTAEGYREHGRIRGDLPPLMAVDPAALAGLPAEALFVAALGWDGNAFEQWLDRVGTTLPEIGLGLAQADAAALAVGAPAVSDVLFTTRGTLWLAVLPSAPFPTVTLAIPGNAGIDRLVEHLGTMAGVDVTAAKTQAIIWPLPQQMPIMVQIRRSASHWLISTDTLRIEELATATTPIDLAPFAALAAGSAPGALCWGDNKLFFQTLGSYAGFALGPMAKTMPPEQLELMKSTFGMLNDMSAILPATRGTMVAAKDGYVFFGENLSLSVGPMAIGAGIGLPAITMLRQKARETRRTQIVKQLVIGCVAWSTDNDGIWPPSLETMATEMQMPEAALRNSYAQGVPMPHFLYLRPVPDNKSWQPVIVENPASGPRGIVVGFADGSARVFKRADAQRLWAEAQRLAADPKAAAEGITADDWVAVHDILQP